MISNRFSSLFLTLGVVAPLVGVTASTACSSKFEGCAASRTCESGGEGGEGPAGGKGGSAGSSSGGKSGSAGNGGALSLGGEGGEAGASGGEAGAGASGGGGGSGVGGSGAGKGGQGGKGGSPDEGMSGEAGMDTGPEPDVTPPTIVSVSPEDEETGVHADTEIRITFSEPMDKVATQLAYVSPAQDLPYANMDVDWNDTSTVLTLRPKTLLEYAESSTEVDAPDMAGALAEIAAISGRAYTFGFAGGARDLAGNPLVGGTWTFTTLRRIHQVQRIQGDNVRRFYGNRNEECIDFMYIGDTDSNRTNFGIFQFNLNRFPANVDAWEAALFYAGERISSEGDPKSLGGVHVFETEQSFLTLTIDSPVGADVGTLAMTGDPHGDIVEVMRSAYANDRVIRFIVRTLQPTNNQNPGTNDRWRLSCEGKVTFTYLVP